VTVALITLAIVAFDLGSRWLPVHAAHAGEHGAGTKGSAG
jgi:hypothetical protein